MDELRKKILLDVCVTPATVIPFAAGLSLLMLSVVLGAGWGFFGFCLCLVGIGFVVTNFIFNYEGVTKRAIEQLRAEKKAEKDRYLDELDAKLASDRDPRDQEALRNLRQLYDSFAEDVKEGRVSVAACSSIHRQVEEIFEKCVSQLSRQHEVWLMSRKVTGDIRAGLMQQKSIILDEVEASVENLANVMGEVRALGLKAQSSELGKLKERLNNQLAAAKAVEQLSAETAGDLSRFSEYTK